MDRYNPVMLSDMRDISDVFRRTSSDVDDMLDTQCALGCRVLVAFCEWDVPVQVTCEPYRRSCGRLEHARRLRHGGDHVDLD